MKPSVVSLLSTACVLASVEACTFSRRASQVLVGPDAVRVPVTGRNTEAQCATTAAAFGYSIAATKTQGDGEPMECILYEDMAGGCDKYQLLTGAATLENITGCDATLVNAVSAQMIEMNKAQPQEATVGGTKAMLIPGVAAVGNAVYSDLKVSSEEECLAACKLYVPKCTAVSTEAPEQAGGQYRCSFHGTPSRGLELEGTNTYFQIVPSAQMQARGLGAVAPPKKAPAPAPAPAVAAKAPAAAATAAAPAPATAPAPAPAAAPVAGLANELEELLYTAPGKCPNAPIGDVPAGKHQESLTAPGKVADQYGDQLGEDGKFEMPYYALENGGSYCVAKGSTNTQVVIGGMFFWEAADGTCVPPPTTADGEPCCEVFMWQPNSAGLYYDNCSMKMSIQPDGLYYFTTEMPGDESVVGWGADPEPHIHYDIICGGCAPNDAFDNGEYYWWNKFYPEEVCALEGCGTGDMAPGPEHKAAKLAHGGQTVYKYDFVLPASKDG